MASCTVRVAVQNSGSVAGDCVVIAYMEPTGKAWKPVAGQLPLRQQVFGFERLVDVQPGSISTVLFIITMETVTAVDEETGNVLSTEGTIDLRFGLGAGEGTILGHVTVTGPDVVVEHMASEDSIH